MRTQPSSDPSPRRYYDLDTYAEVKDPIVDLVIVTAEEWATETGWSTSDAQGA